MGRLLPAVLLGLLLLSCGEAEPATPGGEPGTITGTVLLGPMCPVETDASPCPDEPLAGVTVQAVLEGDVIAAVETDAQGRFTFEVAPGTYAVRTVPDDDPARTTRPVEAVVVAGEAVEIEVQVDSGIR